MPDPADNGATESAITPNEPGENRKANGQLAAGHSVGESTRFGPGNNANPKGRPKGKSLTNAMRKLMDNGLDGQDLTEAMAKKAYQMALKGDFRFFNLIMERLEGKVPDELIGEIRHLVMKFATLADVEQALERSRSTSDS